MPLDSTPWRLEPRIDPEPEVVTILRRAQERIRDPEGWCVGSPVSRSRDNRGKNCAESALALELGVDYLDDKDWTLLHSTPAYELLLRAAEQVKPGTIKVWEVNDDTDHPTVMRMFERAIELAEQEEASHG